MNLINRIQSRFWKEARPLVMPVALGLLIPALAGSPLVRIRIIQDFAVPPEMVVLLFAVCLTFVCAVPFGYELSARTLPLFAAQPSRRWRLWLEKMLVMSLGVLLVAAGAWKVFEYNTEIHRWILILTAMVLSTCPAYTLMSGSSLAGIAMTFAVPAFAVVVTHYAIAVKQNIPIFEESLWTYFGPWAPRVVWAYGLTVGAMGLFRFVRYQQLGHTGEGWHLAGECSGWRHRVSVLIAPNPSTPTLNLIRKEIGLHGAMVKMAVLLLPVWAIEMGIIKLRPVLSEPILILTASVYWMVGLVSVGCATFAEERALGLTGQLLTMPVTRFRAWALKWGTALGLSIVVGLIYPWCLPGLHNVMGEALAGSRGAQGIHPAAILFHITMAALPIYASSFSANSLKAAMNALASIAALYAGLGVAVVYDFTVAKWLGHRIEVFPGMFGIERPVFFDALKQSFGYGIAFLLLVALMRMSYSNFKNDGGTKRSVVLQFVFLLVFGVVASSLGFYIQFAR